MYDDVLSPRLALGQAFPEWTQVWWTYLTGAALPEQPLRRRRPLLLFGRVLGALLAGFGLSAAALGWHALWLLLPAYLCTVGAARYLQLVVVHVAAHDNFTRKRGLDLWAGRLLSVVLLFEEFDRYKRRHCVEHHALRTLSTTKDPTVQFLLSLGIRPGMEPAAMWRRLLLALVSPAFHVRSLYGRIESHFVGTPWSSKALAAAYLAAVLGATVAFHQAALLLVGFVIPLVFIYQAVAAVRLCMEHRWGATAPAERQRGAFTELTPCVYLGEAPPARERRSAPLAWAGAWALWYLKLLGTILIRVLVVPGDSGPAHDYHHVEPRGDWANYIAARRAFRHAKGDPAGPEWVEMWGFFRAVDASFHSFSKASIELADEAPARVRPAARNRPFVHANAE